MSDEHVIHKRRVRYQGTHPRKFEEKYKELQPDKYLDEVQKVVDQGRTPAGMHRPVCVEEILEILKPRPGEIGLDATLGYGGHTEQLLSRLDHQGKLVAIDADPIELPKTEQRLRNLGFSTDFLIIRRMNFAGISKLLADAPEGFDFILADLGVSSMQLDNPSRGFTFKEEGPLDLRLNPLRGEPASKFLQSCSAEELESLLNENADEPYAREIARALHAERNNLQTTRQLGSLVTSTLASQKRPIPQELIKKSITRTFQALRIAVNDEFHVLDLFLRLLPDCLKAGGRVAILTFHSGEDRRVKKAFKQGLVDGIYSQIAPTPLRASHQELRDNPRSASAKLRWAVKG